MDFTNIIKEKARALTKILLKKCLQTNVTINMIVGFQQPNKCECLSCCCCCCCFFFFFFNFFMVDDISICKFNIVKLIIFQVSLNFTIKMLQTNMIPATNKSFKHLFKDGSKNTANFTIYHLITNWCH